MSARTSLSLALPWVGASLLLAGLVCAPVPAHAGCGDYLQPLGNMPNQAAYPTMGHHPGSQHSNSPCSGPNCSRRKAPVPATPAVPVSLDQEHAVMQAALLPPGAGSDRQSPASSAVRPLRRSALIYHPPRFSDTVRSA